MAHQDIEDVLDNPIEIEDEYDDEWKEKRIESESIWDVLTPRQEKFCQLYATDSSCFGNWVTTYLEVYDIDRTKPNRYKTACAWASRMLSNVKVYTRINDLLDEYWLNDTFVDKQTLFLISQQSDFTAKSKMITEYNKIKWRITNKLDLWWEWEEAKKEFYDTLKTKVKEMWKDEINEVLQNILK